jgi:hypothetical protein
MERGYQLRNVRPSSAQAAPWVGARDKTCNSLKKVKKADIFITMHLAQF